MKLTVKTTKKDQVIDITDRVREMIGKSGKDVSLCTVFVAHTTACVTTADLDPGTDLDLLDALRAIAPDLKYRHPHDPGHTNDHILSSIIGPSVSVPVKNGEPVLGTWQRIILIELDGPRTRTLHIRLL